MKIAGAEVNKKQPEDVVWPLEPLELLPPSLDDGGDVEAEKEHDRKSLRVAVELEDQLSEDALLRRP